MAAGGLVVTLLLDFAVIVLVARFFGELAERIRQPPVLGELLGGLILGPGLLAFLPAVLGVVDPSAEQEVLLFLAEIGAIILLFEVGLETNMTHLVRVGRAATSVAIIGIVASVAMGYGVSWGIGASGWFTEWPNDPVFHIFVGATFAATSVGITARVMKDLGRLDTDEARIVLGAAVIDDVGGLLVLAFVAGLVSTQSFDPLALGVVALKAFGFLAVAIVVGSKVVPPLFVRIGSLRVRGVVISSAFAFALLLAWGAAIVQLAPIVGAFAAGMVLAQTRDHHAIHTGVAPMGHVFIPFFFVIMGTAVNLRALGGNVGLVLAVTAILFVVAVGAKALCGLGVRKGEASRAVVGVGMIPRGEVGLIFVGFGIANLHLADWETAALILTVMLTTVIVPPWLKALYRKRPLPVPSDASDLEGHTRIGERSERHHDEH